MRADNLTRGAGIESGYVDYSEITSLQFGASAESSWIKGGAGSPGKPSFRNITITKNVDISTTKFFDKMVRGTTVDLIEIVSTVPNGKNQKVVHKIELKDSFVTNISSSTVEGCEGIVPLLQKVTILPSRQ